MELEKKENIWNIANFLTSLRVLAGFILVYLVFAGFNIITIVAVFAVGQLTDAIDGYVARRFKITTEFGKKFDMLADRALMLLAAVSLLLKFSFSGIFNQSHIFQFVIIFSREIIALPFSIQELIKGKSFPEAKFIGKLTTVLQAITFPTIILSPFYPIFNFSFYLAIVTSVFGVFSGIRYIKDINTVVLDKKKI
jgi:CDP-diacylglycerol--glycerol-3-phosphate 3-phosphatidyltransferase